MIETYPQNPVEPVRESMTFSQYFDTNESARSVLASFGYTLDVLPLVLPQYKGDLPWVAPLQARYQKYLRRVTLLSEISRREFLIAPIIGELVEYFDIEVNSEFSLQVSDRLQGNIDYLLQKDNNLVVIEAKQGDMARGFRQLATEMVAVDIWSRLPSPILYGAVTVGDVWRFVRLDRERKDMVQDVNAVNVPADTEQLARVLIAILLSEEQASV